MKGKYVEDKKDHSTTTKSYANNMFANLHHHPQPQHHHHQPPSLPPPPFHHRFQLSGAAANSEEADSRTPSTTMKENKDHQLLTPPQPLSAVAPPHPTAANDGATIEVVRRPRGRPPGSKNKMKPPVIITREPAAEPSMSPYVLEVCGGVDIIESISRFCMKRNMGLCVLNGSGTILNVTLRQPSTAASTSTVTFHGRFDILSISATIFSSSEKFTHTQDGFTISVGGPQGQVVGGAVVGPLLSASTVYLMAATFNSPSYHKLPAEDEGGGAGGRDSPEPEYSGRGDSGNAPAPATTGDTCGMSNIYSSHLPSDVIWAPNARQLPPPF